MASAGKVLVDAAGQYLEARVKDSVRSMTDRLEEEGLSGLRPNLPNLPKPHLPKLGGGGGDKSGGMSLSQGRPTVVVEDLVVGVPVDVAYEQWTNYPDVPQWSRGVQSVDESDSEEDGETTRWRAKVLWSKRSWEGKVLEEVPEQRLVWRSEGDGVDLRGVLTFHPLAEDATLLLLVLEYRPRGLFEHVGNLFRAPGRRVRLDLKRFRSYVTWQDSREDASERRDGEDAEEVEEGQDDTQDEEEDEEDPQDQDADEVEDDS